jgi:hypothetical protein
MKHALVTAALQAETSKPPPLIEVRGLSKIYATGKGTTVALKELDFRW